MNVYVERYDVKMYIRTILLFCFNIYMNEQYEMMW